MVKKILVLILITLFTISCDRSTDPKNSESIEVNFPLNEKAVYASATYDNNTNQLVGLEIYSVFYDSISEVATNNIMNGKVEAAYLFKDVNNENPLFKESGSIKLTIGDKWIQFEHSEVLSSVNIFMKTNNDYKDTTQNPDKFHQHFPAYPRIIETNKEYSIIRPEKSGDDWSYIALGRKFKTSNMVKWKDQYGDATGIYMTKDHQLFIGNIHSIPFKTIVDEHGIVISEFTTTSSSNSFNVITRRIVDFTNAEYIKDLDYYLDLVKENGLENINF